MTAACLATRYAVVTAVTAAVVAWYAFMPTLTVTTAAASPPTTATSAVVLPVLFEIQLVTFRPASRRRFRTGVRTPPTFSCRFSNCDCRIFTLPAAVSPMAVARPPTLPCSPSTTCA